MSEVLSHYKTSATKTHYLNITLQAKKNWTNYLNFRSVLRKKIKKKNNNTILLKDFNIKNTKEIMKIVHVILNHSEKTLKADINELNKYSI